MGSEKAVVRVGSRVTERFKTKLPVQPDFTLPFLLPTLSTDMADDYRFTLLREGTFFFGDQRVFFDGMMTIPVRGETHSFKNYLHVGDGTLPTNYLIDENNIVILVTHGIVSQWLV